jgi:hypothetical protein
MLKYEPIDIAGDVDCLLIDLLSFSWEDGIATFGLPGERVLRVLFPGEVIVRMLDELALSTEDSPSERHGRVPHHFAYRVFDAPFLHIQSQVWREVNSDAGPVMHYQFVTGGGCLDVLCSCEPEFDIKPSTGGTG